MKLIGLYKSVFDCINRNTFKKKRKYGEKKLEIKKRNIFHILIFTSKIGEFCKRKIIFTYYSVKNTSEIFNVFVIHSKESRTKYY